MIDRVSLLKNVRDQYEQCSKCELSKTRHKVCISKGMTTARFIFVGMCPGYEENQAGEPFIGLSGQLLRKLLSDSNYNPKDVCITNLVKCHPPKNREPSKKEIEACLPWLKKEMVCFLPDVIFTLGKLPTYHVLNMYGHKIKKTFKLDEYFDSPVSITDPIYNGGALFIQPLYHPAYLLRCGNKKNKIVTDILKKYV